MTSEGEEEVMRRPGIAFISYGRRKGIKLNSSGSYSVIVVCLFVADGLKGEFEESKKSVLK